MQVKVDQKSYKNKMDKLKVIIKSKAWREECADFVVNMIYKRTKIGYGVSEQSGTKKKLRDLSPGYIEQRKRNPPTGEAAGIKKSNLTNTGDMLNSITAKLKAKGIELDLANETEREKALYNSINGRDFMFLSKAEELQLRQFMEKRLREEFNKLK